MGKLTLHPVTRLLESMSLFVLDATMAEVLTCRVLKRVAANLFQPFIRSEI